jgi:hypothetical protein
MRFGSLREHKGGIDVPIDLNHRKRQERDKKNPNPTPTDVKNQYVNVKNKKRKINQVLAAGDTEFWE